MRFLKLFFFCFFISAFGFAPVFTSKELNGKWEVLKMISSNGVEMKSPNLTWEFNETVATQKTSGMEIASGKVSFNDSMITVIAAGNTLTYKIEKIENDEMILERFAGKMHDGKFYLKKKSSPGYNADKTVYVDQYENKWNVLNRPALTKTKAASIKTYENTPESIVEFFYASRMRGDDEWKKVVPPEAEWTNKMRKGLEIYKTWTFAEIKVEQITDGGRFNYVKVHFKLSTAGKVTDAGTDEVSVRKNADGNWVIVEVPT